ncbi:hypothetical protein RFI_05428 [Reticulomyxa filosa]|uniref:Uncharacterized protein n=1 Tax=Reticulomyxa filosa TaxID=46433 RepID=X6NZF1_RETFI|nr:hypothetical protein RFI_05428 [Reticulomyxa filosa]|eukprot:ETO31690.1 hypothetical protein RFI_05428 [Reticulomyxa filosa]
MNKNQLLAEIQTKEDGLVSLFSLFVWFNLFCLIPVSVSSRKERDNDEHDVDFFTLQGMEGLGFLKCCDEGTMSTLFVDTFLFCEFEVRAFTCDNDGVQIGEGIRLNVTETRFAHQYRNDYMEIDRNVVFQNEIVYISHDFTQFDNNPEPIAYRSAWIGIIPSHVTSREETVNDDNHVSYEHIQEPKGHTIALRALHAGQFEIRCFTRDDGGQMISEGIPFTVLSLQNHLSNASPSARLTRKTERKRESEEKLSAYFFDFFF